MAAHPLAGIANCLVCYHNGTRSHAHTQAHSQSVSSPSTACTVEGVFYYFRQRAALCQLPLSLSRSFSLSALLVSWRNREKEKHVTNKSYFYHLSRLFLYVLSYFYFFYHTVSFHTVRLFQFPKGNKQQRWTQFKEVSDFVRLLLLRLKDNRESYNVFSQYNGYKIRKHNPLLVPQQGEI